MSLRIPLAATMVLVGLACLPGRPPNVPKDAPWVGTRDEGCFLRIGDREIVGWRMEGWDKSGALVVDGVWELDGIARAKISPKEITRFDGGTFHLADGATIARR